VEGGSADGLAKTVKEASRSMSSLMRCVLVTTRQHDADLSSQLGDDGLPNLEVIHSGQEELAQWFSFNRAASSIQVSQESRSTASAEVAAS
jgi:hypothetical protein